MVERKKILLVEDDAGLRALFKLALRVHGFDVHEAGGGYEALRQLETLEPDLVVLDLGLPGIDGLTVHRELSARAMMRQIPIVIVTASDEDLAHVDVACILRKPILTEELVRVVRQCLGMGVTDIDLS
jgi:DNA-binding response OmpR family regulator